MCFQKIFDKYINNPVSLKSFKSLIKLVFDCSEQKQKQIDRTAAKTEVRIIVFTDSSHLPMQVTSN